MVSKELRKDTRLDAEAAVNDAVSAVNNMFVSKNLRGTEDVAYIDAETRERKR